MKIKFLCLCLAVLCALQFVGCGDGKEIRDLKAAKADSLVFQVGLQKKYPEMRLLVDSLEMTGDLSPLNANRWRGVSYYREGNYRMAEVCYRKALNVSAFRGGAERAGDL